jgi:hypothetical protein
MLAAHTASIYSAACTVSCAAAYTAHYSQLQLGADSAACTVSCAAAYTAHYSQLQLGADIIVSSNSMGARKIRATMTRWAPPQVDPHPPSSPLSKLGSLITLGAKRRRRRRGLTSTITLYYIHFITYLEGGDHKVAPNPHSHVQRNWPHVSTRQHSRLHHLVAWTI